jgi:hypothetical protein
MTKRDWIIYHVNMKISFRKQIQLGTPLLLRKLDGTARNTFVFPYYK